MAVARSAVRCTHLQFESSLWLVFQMPNHLPRIRLDHYYLRGLPELLRSVRGRVLRGVRGRHANGRRVRRRFDDRSALPGNAPF